MLHYKETFRRHMRLSILKVLNDAPEYSCNDSVLRDALEEFAFKATRDVVRTELYWLQEQGFATLSEAGHLIVAKATARGVDVALGRAIHPDIKRPGA